jgi:hypothetical protein
LLDCGRVVERNRNNGIIGALDRLLLMNIGFPFAALRFFFFFYCENFDLVIALFFSGGDDLSTFYVLNLPSNRDE